MRGITKKQLLLLIVMLIIISTKIFCAYDPDEFKIDFLNIEEVTYAPTTVNTTSSYQTGSVSTEKVLKITEIETQTTSAESFRAVPHINIENYLATISNDTNSSVCRLLIKTTVIYDNIAEETTWYEVDDVKLYLYNRTNVAQTASSFTTTLYYLIENPNNVLNPDGSANTLLTVDTGGTTSYYMFYLLGGVEQPYYTSNLADSLSLQAAPEQFEDPSISTYLQINTTKPSTWTETALFENIGVNNLEWIIGIRAGTVDGSTSTDRYYLGLTITSENNYILKSKNSGTGLKEYPYTLRISRNKTNTHDVNAGDEFLITRFRDTKTKYFYIYSYSTTQTTNLNAGRFSDNIYLNFITDVDSNYGNKEIRTFNI